MNLKLTDVLDWGFWDVEVLEDYLETAKKFNISLNDIKKDIEVCDGNITDINMWFFSTMTLIFYRILDEVEELVDGDKDMLEKILVLRDNFNPFINYMDSWFNNLLDDIDLNQDKEKILEDVIEKLREDD